MSDYESSDYEEEEYEEEYEEGEEEDEYEEGEEEYEDEDDLEFSNLSINPNPVTSVFIGNPGVGKSTLLNQLLQEVRFKSGLSFGNGLTTTLQKEAHRDGNIYIDTPGLSDIKLRTKAAQEIKEALTSSTGEFKVFFVITLEGGRIRPDDMTTIRLVLNAAKSIGTNYSIIISKASKPIRDKIAKDPQAHKDLLTGLNDGLTQEGHGTTSIFFANYNEELNDADNALAPLDKDLKLFVDTAVKAKKITQVQNIDVPNWENMFNKLCSELDAMKKDKQVLERKMREQESRYMELLKSQQAQRQQQYSPSLFQAVNKIVNPFAWF